MTCIDRENDFMEVWIMKDYNERQLNKKHSINIWVLTRKEPYVSHSAFYNADIILMGKYFPNMTFFNLKTRSIDMVQLGRGLLYGCFLFWFIFITEEKTQLNTTLELPDLQSHHPLGGTPEHPQHNKWSKMMAKHKYC